MSPDVGALFEMGGDLLGCVQEALDASPYPSPDRACVIPGPTAAFWDCCSGDKGGQLTVSIVRAIETNAFPNVSVAGGGVVGAVVSSTNCALPWTVVEYLVTIVRCTPTMKNNRFPKCEEIEPSAMEQAYDLQNVRHGLKCCLIGMDKRIHPWALGESLAIGPEGGCAGSTVTAFVGFQNCRPCNADGT